MHKTCLDSHVHTCWIVLPAWYCLCICAHPPYDIYPDLYKVCTEKGESSVFPNRWVVILLDCWLGAIGLLRKLLLGGEEYTPVEQENIKQTSTVRGTVCVEGPQKLCEVTQWWRWCAHLGEDLQP